MRGAMTMLLTIAGCAGGRERADAVAMLVPGSAAPLGNAEAVGAADLDGTGNDTIVRVADGVASWAGRTAELGGRVHVVARGDIDADGREELLVGTGMGRGARGAPARLHALDDQGATLLWERAGERAQITDLVVDSGRIWIAAFVDRWNVEAGWLENGAIEATPPVRLGMQQRPLSGGRSVVGRLYGEEPRSDGDLRLRGASSETPLPSHRGVRALAVAELDGDEEPELIVGDGWHHRYGTDGDPRVVLISGPSFTDARTIAWLDGDYAARAFEVDGTGREARILVTGARGVTLLQRDPLGWSPTFVGPVAETGNAVLARQEGRISVVISGKPAVRIPLENAP